MLDLVLHSLVNLKYNNACQLPFAVFSFLGRVIIEVSAGVLIVFPVLSIPMIIIFIGCCDLKEERLMRLKQFQCECVCCDPYSVV